MPENVAVLLQYYSTYTKKKSKFQIFGKFNRKLELTITAAKQLTQCDR